MDPSTYASQKEIANDENDNNIITLDKRRKRVHRTDNLEGVIFPNVHTIEEEFGLHIVNFDSLVHTDVARQLFQLFVMSAEKTLVMPSSNTFYHSSEIDPYLDSTYITILKDIPHELANTYVIRTTIDNDNVPITTLYGEYDGLRTTPETVVEKHNQQFMKRTKVPLFNYQNFPNEIKVERIIETLGLVLPFDEVKSFEEIQNLVSDYNQLIADLISDDEED